MTHPMSHEERPRVLVVDDEKFIREILAEFLGMEGYLVRTAEDGSGALAELSRAHYDMVISDLKMPRMGGLEKQRLSAENLRLKEALGLYKVSEAIAASLSLDEVLSTVAESALLEMH